MTESSTKFLTYFFCIKGENVRIVDASYTLVSGTSSINYTLIIILFLVFHVSSFPDSLLYISVIIRELNCKIKFFSDYCIFQDIRIGKKIDTDRL